MTAPAPAAAPARRTSPPPAALLVAALGLAVALRAVSTPAFVAVLAGAAWLSGWRPRRPAPSAAAWGLVGAVLLVAGPLTRLGPHPPGRSSLFPWALGVALVVGAEEAFLRGALWRVCVQRAGGAVALVATSGAFALVHLPLYGWKALPLDFTVGLVLGGLRLVSGSVAAPALAHLLADGAGWWLL
ncbi:MAG TPA: CPBP family intramembrane glutamic endopeptidase [Acidimicrobiales bacterium]|nr:CPBP family intramembrane glutamic endopeptidase [Acidimicrobiales bacterium]